MGKFQDVKGSQMRRLTHTVSAPWGTWVSIDSPQHQQGKELRNPRVPQVVLLLPKASPNSLKVIELRSNYRFGEEEVQVHQRGLGWN